MKLNGKIKNIIFDLGGVIINLNLKNTLNAFSNLTGLSLADTEKKLAGLSCLHPFETGICDNHTFRENTRLHFNMNLSDQDIDHAWNAMLLDIPAIRIELMQYLKFDYQVFILSNTNGIHYKEVEDILYRSTGIASFNSLCDKVYLSHEIGMRKPDQEIYSFVLQDACLDPSETLFIDDTLLNISPARELGIKALHLQEPETITDIFSDFINQNIKLSKHIDPE